MATHPVTTQPQGKHVTEHLTNFDKDWHSAALACCCCCWYVGLVAERAGESFWAGCCNAPIALLAVRSKVRGAFRIRRPHRYDLPKGHMEPGEAELQTALRGNQLIYEI
ncbi:unnamed protein product [Rotaria sp. Silwood1]|nr:unnamed protein product [Rotaria sp. Silwood1]